MAALKNDYEVEEDWTGSLYCGIKLHWNYDKGYLDTTMENYVRKNLLKYNHEKPRKPQDCPYEPHPKKYGTAAQLTDPPDDSAPLNEQGVKWVQRVVGSFLYYARAIDATILMALNAIANEQKAPTQRTKERVLQFLDYMATHPNAVVRFYKSDMILQGHSDASYLSAPEARSRAAGYWFLGLYHKAGNLSNSMVPSLSYAPCSNLSLHLQRSRASVPSFSTPRRLGLCGSPYMNLAIRNHPPLSTLTTQLLLE
eukprot:CCRYP_013414-RA/>CCRYP_013414-RA protein AED:0.38 eAED:0.38 QI:0/-1/0/1/-1/1/1/0/253